MSPYLGYKPKKIAAAIAVLLAATLPLAGQGATAGRVNFAYGPVKAEAPDGVKRPLHRGSIINPGDTIHTHRGGAQVRFTDGAYLSLKPATSFRVDEYRYTGNTDGEERGFFSLLRGGLRTITGLIGKVNRKTYRITTSTATIGIRGTAFRIEQVTEAAGGGWLYSVAPGSEPIVVNPPDGSTITVQANEGLYVNPAGEVFIIADMQAVSREDDTVTELGTTEAVETTENYQAGNEIITEIDNHLVPGPGYHIAFGIQANDGGVFADRQSVAYASFKDLPDLTTEFSSGAPPDPSVTYSVLRAVQDPPLNDVYVDDAGGHIDGKSIADTDEQYDGIGWGRWYTPTSEGAALKGNVFHYTVGKKTLGEDMPTEFSAVYDLGHRELDGHWFGATRPTAFGGFEGRVTAGTLTADFGNGGVIANLTVDFSHIPAGEEYFLETEPMVIEDAAFGGSGNWTVTHDSLGAPSGSCASGCATTVTGFFVGNQAARAAMGYSINGTAFGAVAGSAAFGNKAPSNIAIVPGAAPPAAPPPQPPPT